MSSARYIFTRTLTSIVILGLLTSLATGCKGKGGNNIISELPPEIILAGLKALQFNPNIPIAFQVKTDQEVLIQLAISISKGPSDPYNTASALPGYIDPTKIVNLTIPAGGSEFVFWWNAIADFASGQRYETVFLKLTATTMTGLVSEITFGPMTLAFEKDAAGQVPPYVPGAELDDTVCGVPYAKQLVVEGGTAPFVWSLLPPGAQLPHFLELTHDGIIQGFIPDDIGPTQVTFVAQVTDSNPILRKASAGEFSFFINCEIGPQECAAPPEITTNSLPAGMEGEAYLLQASGFGGHGGASWSIAAGFLPNGITFDDSGLFSGTPAAGTAGDYPITLQLCDLCPLGVQCDTAQLVLTINQVAVECAAGPTIITQALSGATETFPYQRALEAGGGEGILNWTLSAGTLPDGLVLTPGGVISGVPALGSEGEYPITVQVCDSCPLGAQCDTQDYNLIVVPQNLGCPPLSIISPTKLPDAEEGAVYDFTFLSTGGEGALTWVLNNPVILPDGLTFADGVISGTPAAGTAGNHVLNVQVSDECDPIQTYISDFELTVAGVCLPISILSPGADDAFISVAYELQLEVDGGVSPFDWALLTGVLPDDITLSPSGLLSGIAAPLSEGLYELEFEVTDSCTPVPQTQTHLFNLTVSQKPCAPGPALMDISLPTAGENVEYNYQLSVIGGEPLLTFEVLGDADLLPSSLVLGGTDGTISGIPDPGTTGLYNIHFQVTDSCDPPRTNDAYITFEIIQNCDPGPVITTTSVDSAIVGETYSFQFQATGGHGTLNWALIDDGGIPGIFTLDETGLFFGEDPLGLLVPGQWTIEVMVCDGCPLNLQCDVQQFVFAVMETACAPGPTIDLPLNTSVPAGMFINYQLAATGGEGSLFWTVVDSTPPLPLTVLVSPNGLIIGTTESTDAGIYAITVEVCDACVPPQCDSQVFTLDLQSATGCGALPPSLQDVTIPTPSADNSPYSFTLTVNDGDGALSFWAQDLPPGININPTTGEISGAVAPGDSGLYRVLIGVTDSCAPVSQADSQDYIWVII